MHFFGLIFIEALKMAENIEKQSFTFFAFLPLYIGVSGSLVSRMRKISMTSIENPSNIYQIFEYRARRHEMKNFWYQSIDL